MSVTSDSDDYVSHIEVDHAIYTNKKQVSPNDLMRDRIMTSGLATVGLLD